MVYPAMCDSSSSLGSAIYSLEDRTVNTYYKGNISRVKIFPIRLPLGYIIKVYQRENHWWGRLINDIQYWLIRKITK